MLAGVATGFCAVGLDSPVVGSHANVYGAVPPEGVDVTLTPAPDAHRTPPVAEIVGFAFTVTVAVDEPWQPFASLTVTVYMVVLAGVATGFCTLLLDSPVVGSHAKV